MRVDFRGPNFYNYESGFPEIITSQSSQSFISTLKSIFRRVEYSYVDSRLQPTELMFLHKVLSPENLAPSKNV